MQCLQAVQAQYSGICAEFVPRPPWRYDYFYLPCDIKSLCNRGYAFVNLMTDEAAHRYGPHERRLHHCICI